VELETCNKTYNIHNGDSNDDTSVYSSTIARSFTMSRGGFYQDKGGLPTADAAVFSHSTIAPQHIRSSLMVCHGKHGLCSCITTGKVGFWRWSLRLP